MGFLRDDVVEIFDSEPSIFQTLSKKAWAELLKYPLANICDKVGRQCDVLETLENLYYILIESLKTSNRFQELPYFIDNGLIKEDLYAVFIEGQTTNSDARLLPKRLKITDDVKAVVSLMCPKTENCIIPRAIFDWLGPYGTHNDVALIQGNHENWHIEGLVQKICVKSRHDWDGRHIIQGIQVFLENGETQAFGMDLNDTVSVETLEPPTKQHIRFIDISSGFYIDSIGIITNQGEKIGPIGGTGGTKRRLQKLPHGNPYVGGIRGKTVVTQGLPTICKVQIKRIFPYSAMIN